MKRFLAVLVLGAALPGASSAAIPRVRLDLIHDIEDMQAYVGDKAQDAITVPYRVSLTVRHDEAVKPQKLASINALRARFENERNDFLNAFFAAHHDEFKDDPKALNRYFHDRLQLAATLRKIAEDKTIKLSAESMRRIARWRGMLDNPDVSGDQVSMLTQAVGRSNLRRVEEVQFRSQFVPPQKAPETGLSAPPTVDPTSYQTQKPSVSRLTSLIANVYGSAKDYVKQVANAIVDSSVARNIDQRLTAALVWAESTFDATAGSWAGCKGLGQLSEDIAALYHVGNRGNVEQNMKGTAGYLGDLLSKHSTHDERAYVQGLFAQGAARVQRGAGLDATFAELWPNIPVGIEDAVASYNAGSVPKGGHWYDLNLPRVHANRYRAPDALTVFALQGKVDSEGVPLVDHCFDRPDHDRSHCQTLTYVPRVMKNYFKVFVQTTPAPGTQMAADSAPAVARNG